MVFVSGEAAGGETGPLLASSSFSSSFFLLFLLYFSPLFFLFPPRFLPDPTPIFPFFPPNLPSRPEYLEFNADFSSHRWKKIPFFRLFPPVFLVFPAEAELEMNPRQQQQQNPLKSPQKPKIFKIIPPQSRFPPLWPNFKFNFPPFVQFLELFSPLFPKFRSGGDKKTPQKFHFSPQTSGLKPQLPQNPIFDGSHPKTTRRPPQNRAEKSKYSLRIPRFSGNSSPSEGEVLRQKNGKSPLFYFFFFFGFGIFWGFCLFVFPGFCSGFIRDRKTPPDLGLSGERRGKSAPAQGDPIAVLPCPNPNKNGNSPRRLHNFNSRTPHPAGNAN